MAPPENTTTTFQGLLNWRLALHVFISIFRPREVWNKLLLGAFQPRVVKNPIFWGMNTPSNPNKHTYCIQFGNWLQKLVVSSGAGGNPILKFGNSRFFRSNVGRWEHDFRCFSGSMFPLHLTQLTKFFVGEKNSSNLFWGGIMFLYYPPHEITLSPTKGSWEAEFPLPIGGIC